MTWRASAKLALHGLATIAVLPLLASYWFRAAAVGRDRALEGSTQLLSMVPGVTGQFLRRAFLARTLARCARSAIVEFGTLFSRADARLDDHVYVGPRCHLGLVHLERDVMLAAGVHVPSGAHTHGTDLLHVPFREQPGTRRLVRIGAGSWVGSGAVVLADVGEQTVVGAGAVVTRPLGDRLVAAGVPARVVRKRNGVEALPA